MNGEQPEGMQKELMIQDLELQIKQIDFAIEQAKVQVARFEVQKEEIRRRLFSLKGSVLAEAKAKEKDKRTPKSQ